MQAPFPYSFALSENVAELLTMLSLAQVHEGNDGDCNVIKQLLRTVMQVNK
jgi:hypothetical protein